MCLVWLQLRSCSLYTDPTVVVGVVFPFAAPITRFWLGIIFNLYLPPKQIPLAMGQFDTGPNANNTRRHGATREYTVGWICALPVELAAAQAMLDEEYAELPRAKFDPNLYTLGRIGEHNVVITCLPAGHMGIGPAAAGAARMVSRFRSIRFGLMVGIGGGVPSASVDIRLGDVVVSHPFRQHGGVVQYDLGKTVRAGQTIRTGSLNSPPPVLLNAVSQFRADRFRGRDSFHQYMVGFQALPRFGRANSGPDFLFRPSYAHRGRLGCDGCDKEQHVQRSARQQPEQVEVHYGTIASGNQVMRDGITRDLLSQELGGVLCFEMEAAGLMNGFPCLVIRGISDYADSHKSKLWQPYAAATAAACAKAILFFVPPSETSINASGHPTSEYDISSSLRALSIEKFIDRPKDLQALEVGLLPRSQRSGRRIMTLHGIAGIGKTQLAANFVKQNQCNFSSVFWLDVSNTVAMTRSIAAAVARIRTHLHGSEGLADARSPVHGVNGDLHEMITWLGRRNNSGWLLVLDDVGEMSTVCDYIPDVDHGTVLITSRSSQLSHVGESWEVSKTDRVSSEAIFNLWCSRDLGRSEVSVSGYRGQKLTHA
jgi:nucleoside phosphorylase